MNYTYSLIADMGYMTATNCQEKIYMENNEDEAVFFTFEL